MAHAGIPSHQVSALFPLTHPLQIFFIYTRHSLGNQDIPLAIKTCETALFTHK